MVVERKFISDSIVKDEITKYLAQKLSRAGFSRIDIQKTPMLTRITVHVTNPGKVIGRGGETIKQLTTSLKEKFDVEEPQINVAEVQNPMLEPRLVAKYIANALERGARARSLLHGVLKEIVDNGAMGVEIIATGKLAAKSAQARSMKLMYGYIPKAGYVVKLANEAHVASYPKYGAIGITVRIVQPGTIFPGREIKKAVALPKSIEGAS